MNPKVADARKILFDLRKKYCVDNVKKFSKTISSSSDSDSDLSSDEVLKPSSISRKSSAEKISIVSPDHESARLSVKSKHSSTDKLAIDSEAKRNRENSISETSFVSSRNSKTDTKSLVNEDVLSESSIYSIRTDIKDDFHSDVEEDLSVASDSSSVNILANVHVISDDMLDDAETNFSSDHSNIDHEGRSTRLSVVHSIKSIQLGSPLEPPNLEQYDYESDFESSDSESQGSSLPPKIILSFNSSTGSHNEEVSLKLNEYVLNEPDEDVTYNKEHDRGSYSKSDSDQHSYSDVSEGSFVDEERSEVNEKTTNLKDESIVEHISSRNSSVSEDTNEHLSLASYSDSSKQDFQNKPNSEIIEHNSIENKETNVDGKKLSENIAPFVTKVCTKPVADVEVKSYSSSSVTDVEQKEIHFEDDLNKKDNYISNIVSDGVNLNIKKSTCINVGVQTSRTDNINSENARDESVYSHKRRQRKFYINTSVKSAKHRPVVIAGKFNLTGVEDHDYNPHSFIDREGLSVEELMLEMFRNQIAMTKHLMEGHQRLYMQCCEAVQSMNEAYKKDKIYFIKS